MKGYIRNNEDPRALTELGGLKVSLKKILQGRIGKQRRHYDATEILNHLQKKLMIQVKSYFRRVTLLQK